MPQPVSRPALPLVGHSWTDLIAKKDIFLLDMALAQEGWRECLWTDTTERRAQSPLVLCVENRWLDGARLIMEKGGDGSEYLAFENPRSTPIFHRSIVEHAARIALKLKNDDGQPFFDLFKTSLSLEKPLRVEFFGEKTEMSFLSFAACYDRAYAIEWMMSRATARKRDPDGITPFMWAASSNSLGALKLLAPASDRNALSETGMNALMRAAHTPINASRSLAWLANKKGARQQSLAGETALMMAAENRNGIERVRILAPLSNVDARRLDGDTALLIACKIREGAPNDEEHQAETLAIAQCLAEHGARLDQVDAQGRTPLALAAGRQLWPTVDFLAMRLPAQAIQMGLRESCSGKLPQFEALMQARELAQVVESTKPPPTVFLNQGAGDVSGPGQTTKVANKARRV